VGDKVPGIVREEGDDQEEQDGEASRSRLQPGSRYDLAARFREVWRVSPQDPEGEEGNAAMIWGLMTNPTTYAAAPAAGLSRLIQKMLSIRKKTLRLSTWPRCR
jgi:hypothetical protein